MGIVGQTLSAGSHASAHSVGSKGPRGPQIPFRSGAKPRRNLGLFVVKRTHVESMLLLPRGYDLLYCLLTCLLLLRDRNGVGLPLPPNPQPDTAPGGPTAAARATRGRLLVSVWYRKKLIVFHGPHGSCGTLAPRVPHGTRGDGVGPWGAGGARSRHQPHRAVEG